jgi:hypothetical protein
MNKYTFAFLSLLLLPILPLRAAPLAKSGRLTAADLIKFQVTVLAHDPFAPANEVTPTRSRSEPRPSRNR